MNHSEHLAPRATEGRTAGGLTELCERIWRLEKEFDLVNRRVAGIYYWPLIRYSTFNLLHQKIASRGPNQPRFEQSIARKIFRNLSTFFTDATSLPWGIGETFDTILVPHPRKHIRDGQSIEIASEGVIRDPNIGRLLILDWQGSNVRYNSAAQAVVCRRSIIAAVAQFRGRIFVPRYFSQCSEEYARLNLIFNREVGTDFPISAMSLARYISVFAEARSLIRVIFKSSGAKRLFVVNGYGEWPYIAAARDLGIQSLELQHGLISRYHLGYSYPGRPNVHYTADKLLLFGKFWADNVDLPGGMTAHVIGSHNLLHHRGKQIGRVPRRVVVLSQGAIGVLLFDEAVRAASLAKDWHFIFRPHPGDQIEDFRTRLAKMGASAPTNFIITGHENVYKLLASADVQLGVYSTSLFEGMALGARTIILALPGWENAARSIELGDAVVAQNATDIAALLAFAPVTRDPEKYYCSPVSSIVEKLDLHD